MAGAPSDRGTAPALSPWVGTGNPVHRDGSFSAWDRGCVWDMADCEIPAEAGWREAAKAWLVGFEERSKGFGGWDRVLVKLEEGASVEVVEKDGRAGS